MTLTTPLGFTYYEPSDPPDLAAATHSLAGDVDRFLTGTWTTITLAAGVTAVNPCQFMVKGNTVFWQGLFHGTSAFPANGGPYVIVAAGGVPSGARPAIGKNMPVVSTGGSPGLLQVATDGSVSFVNGPAVAGNVAFGDGQCYPLG